MHYVYVLYSAKDGNFYTGCAGDLKERLALHNNGKVPSTAERRPLTLVYYEACVDSRDAFHREKYLKSTYGKRYIRNRLKHYFADLDL